MGSIFCKIMGARTFQWIVKHRFVAVLLLMVGILGFVLVHRGASVNTGRIRTVSQHDRSSMSPSNLGMDMKRVESESAMDSPIDLNLNNGHGGVVLSERKEVVNASLSLVAEDVEGVIDTIQNQALDIGGFVVRSAVDYPEETASGSIIVRVPRDMFKETVEAFRMLGTNVLSYHVDGYDLTDQYIDIETRLDVLEQNKARFEDIMKQAVQIDDILRVQREIFSLQEQIDKLRGRKQYLEQESALVRITVFVSSDELALPYIPDNAWRPEVIVKKAMRSLVGTLQGMGTVAIWVGVYAVVWAPLVGAVGLGWWHMHRHNSSR